MPATAQRKIQIGKEGAATWGGDVAATVRLIGVTDASLQVVDNVVQSEQLGYLMPAVTSAQTQTHAEASVTQDATYQDITYWLDGVFGAATGSANAGTQYVYHYVAATSAVVTRPTYTMEYGATNAEYGMLGAVPTSMEISMEAGGVWQTVVQLVGKDAEAEAMTTGLAIRTVQHIKSADTAFEVGAWANSTYTAVAGTLISANLTINPGVHVKQFLGSLNPASFGETRWEGQLTTVLEFNTTAKAYVDGLFSGLVQRRFKIEASQTNPTRKATIYFAGTLVDGATLFEDRDGNMTVSLTWNGTYSSTLTNWLQIEVTHEDADLWA